jgi:serine/threonine protein kinase
MISGRPHPPLHLTIFTFTSYMTDQTRIGRYEILEFIGSGTYAVVYRARDTLLQRLVALKVLKPAWARDPEISARFLREAQAAANLIHPQIAWVYDMGESEGRHYFAARLIDGQPLDKTVAARGPFPWLEAVQVLDDIGSALDYAHSQGIIHRDVKPQNILIGKTEGAVLTDFGLTRALTDTQRLTQAGSIVGTPQYIPPEVWNGEQAGAAADQYALACIFFEMLTGKILFEGQVVETIIRGHLNVSKLLDRRSEKLPEGTFDILGRALAPKPEDRYPTIGELVGQLRGLTPHLQSDLPAAESAVDLPLPDVESPSVSVEPAAPHPGVETQQIKDHVDKKTGNLEPSSEWFERLERVYRRLSPRSTGRLRSSRRYRLEFKLITPGTPSDEPGDVLMIDREQIILGRSSTNDVVVDYPDISRQHASLVFTSSGVMLKDLRSTNGTFLNGERVIAEVLLRNGDEIRLGSSVRFIYLEE